MATINLLNSGWQVNKQTSDISVDTTSQYVSFQINTSNTTGRAKACIEIDASKYDTISFSYSNVSRTGTTDLVFGIFDNMEYTDTSGVIVLKWEDFDATNGGSISTDISTLSGTKYVGFRFYGNTAGTGLVKEKPYITSLTATEKGYTLTYNANGGSGAPNSVKKVTSATISSTIPTRSGYDFLGWSTSEYETYASYTAGDTIYLSSDVTLYAVWRKFYTISYDANGGSNAPASDKKIDGQTITITGSTPTPPADASVVYKVTLDANGGTCSQDSVNVTNIATHRFANWNTKQDGSGTSYQSYGLYANDSDITLYAQYTSTITYNSTALPTPSRSGYEFLGWSANKEDISGIIGEYTPTESETTLYATWRRKGLAYIRDDTGTPSLYEVWIRDSSGWNQYIPYIYTISGWTEYSG